MDSRNNVSHTKESQRIYFDYISNMRTVVANWDIAIYLITVYYTHYLQIRNFQEGTVSLCNKTNESFKDNCNFICFTKQFDTSKICSYFESESEQILSEFEYETENIFRIIEKQSHSRNKQHLYKIQKT